MLNAWMLPLRAPQGSDVLRVRQSHIGHMSRRLGAQLTLRRRLPGPDKAPSVLEQRLRWSCTNPKGHKDLQRSRNSRWRLGQIFESDSSFSPLGVSA